MSYTTDLIKRRRELGSSGPTSRGSASGRSFTSNEIQRRRDAIKVSGGQPTGLPPLSRPSIKVSEPDKEPGLFSKAREKISSIFKRPPKIKPVALPSGQFLSISSPSLPKDFDLTPSRESAQEGKLTKETHAKLRNFYDPQAIKSRRKSIQDNVIRASRPTREGYREPGLFGSVIESIKESTIGLGVSLGATAEMIGNMTNSILLSGAGQRLQRRAQVTLAENPEWREEKNAKWGPKKIVRLVAGAVPSLLGTVASTFVAGPVGGATFAFGLESGSTFKEATEAGVTEGEATKKAFTVGSVNAILETLFPASIFDKKKIGKEATEQLSKSIFKKVIKRAKDFGVKFTKEGTLEGTTESLQELWSNIIATSYDENRNIWDGLAEAFVGGFGSGGIVATTLQSGEHTPQEVLDVVIGSEIQDTPEGKILLQKALEAQQTGDNIVISPEEEITGVEPTTAEQKPTTARPQEQATSGIELADKGIYADLTNEQLDFLKDEVKNIDFTKDDRPHLSPIPSLERSELKKVSVEEIREQSPNFDEALKKFEAQAVKEEVKVTKIDKEVAQAKKEIAEAFELRKTAPERATLVSGIKTKSELDSFIQSAQTFVDERESKQEIEEVTKSVPIKDVQTNLIKVVEERANTQTPKIKALEESFKKGDKIPPIPVFEKDGKFITNKDGFHRLTAQRNLGVENIEVRVESETELTGTQKQIEERAKAKKVTPEKPKIEEIKKDVPTKKKKEVKKEKPPKEEPKKKAKEEKKPDEKIPKGFKESRVIERVKDTLQSEVDISETIYKTLTLDDIARRAVDLVNNDPDLARDIISGNGVVPEGTTKASILIASAEVARKAGDFKTQKDLIIQRSFMQTRHGQEIVTERLVNDLSSDRFIRDVIKVRMDRVIKKIKKDTTKAKAFTNKVTKQADVATKKVRKRALSKIESAQKILDDLIC